VDFAVWVGYDVLNMASLRKRFGQRVRTLRKRAGLTQEELAGQAGISVDFLSLVERGVNAPSFETLEKLADALGIAPKDLFEFGAEEC
jgi:transcriptional regulator with XRE-family HTH domain